MKYLHLCSPLLCLLFFIAPISAENADLVLKNGAVYTLDASRTWAQCLAVKEGRLVYVGSNEGVEPWLGESTKVEDLYGAMVLPGFHDSHVHPAISGVELLQCNLHEARSVDEVFQEIESYEASHSDKPWLVGGGWQVSLFPPGQPNKSQLDKIISHKPAFLASSDAHTAWVNSKALEMAGISADTPDPPGGQIERDERGHPTGLLREEAIQLVGHLLPASSPEEYRQGLLDGLAVAKQFGVTSLIEANASTPILEAYQRLERENLLTARVVAALSTDAKRGTEQVEELKLQRERYRGDLLRANSVKLYADGVIEGHTAALLEPYHGKGHRGLMIWPEAVYAEMISALDKAKFQIHVHAIGDRAIKNTLDQIEAAMTENGRWDSRHHLAHLQLLDPRDIPRFRNLGTIANLQPFWAFRDDFISKLTEPFLGPQRSQWLYPFRSFQEQGVTIVAGSDWSVTTMNPLRAIQVALTRSDPEVPEQEAWLAQQRMDLPSLLAWYTINGAYGMNQEKQTGSLEVGKWADLVVLEHNLFDLPKNKIGQVRVLKTVLAGKTVYTAPAK